MLTAILIIACIILVLLLGVAGVVIFQIYHMFKLAQSSAGLIMVYRDLANNLIKAENEKNEESIPDKHRTE